MLTLLDTNILLRCVQAGNPMGILAKAAVDVLLRSGRTLCISSQNIYEFLAVSTKPISENGLGWSHEDADAALSILLGKVDIFYDSPAVVQETRRLVVAHRVTGKKVHDGRLAAVASVHGIAEILTFNEVDFSRYGLLRVLTPAKVMAGSDL